MTIQVEPELPLTTQPQQSSQQLEVLRELAKETRDTNQRIAQQTRSSTTVLEKVGKFVFGDK